MGVLPLGPSHDGVLAGPQTTAVMVHLAWHSSHVRASSDAHRAD